VGPKNKNKIFDVICSWNFTFPVKSCLIKFYWLHFCRTRLVAVATQKFIAEVASDALQYAT